MRVPTTLFGASASFTVNVSEEPPCDRKQRSWEEEELELGGAAEALAIASARGIIAHTRTQQDETRASVPITAVDGALFFFLTAMDVN